MGTTCLLEVVREVTARLLQDPRVNPRRGDVLDDDPPLVPLTVVAMWPNEGEPNVVEAERRQVWLGQIIVRGRWRGSLAAWRKEMMEATVLQARK